VYKKNVEGFRRNGSCPGSPQCDGQLNWPSDSQRWCSTLIFMNSKGVEQGYREGIVRGPKNYGNIM
jgi:hypothetical protein